MKDCTGIESLLIRKFGGDLSADEKVYLDTHLAECASCAAEEERLGHIWGSFDFLPEPHIPANLDKNTRAMIDGYLKWERLLVPLISKVTQWGSWAFGIPLIVGLVMTVVSYSLVRNAFGVGVHHHYIFFSLFGVWWLLFTLCFWVLLRMGDHSVSPLRLVSAQSMSITFLTLIISFLAFEIEPLSQSRIYAASKLATATAYLLGMGNIFIASWWIHCCVAAFIGALTFGAARLPLQPGNLLVAALIATVLLVPAILLQGSSHNHGYGIVAFAIVGSYAGALVGLLGGVFIGRHISFQATVT